MLTRGGSANPARSVRQASDPSKAERLFRCVLEGHLAGVRELLAEGADPNAKPPRSEEGVKAFDLRRNSSWSALHHAVDYGRTDIAQALLDAGADVHAASDHPGTPIALAAERGRTECVRLLLERGADPSQAASRAIHHLECAQLLVEGGSDPSVAVRPAVLEDRPDVLADVLQRGASPLGWFNYFAPHGQVVATPRMIAVFRGHDRCAALLAGRHPYASLSDAAADGSLEVARDFWQRGSSLMEREVQGNRPLDWALLAGKPQMVSWLLERGVALEHRGALSSAAEQAVRGGSIEVLALLRARKVSWEKALRAAMQRPRLGIIEWLLENVRHSEEELAESIQTAVESDRDDILELFAKYGMEVYRPAGRDMLMRAAAARARRVFEFLLARGADPLALVGDRSVLDCALEGARPDLNYEFDEADLADPFVQRLLQLGARSQLLK